MSFLDALPAVPGSYILVLHADQPASLAVGRLGLLTVTPGWYLYVGSALGSGGLAGRLRHHAQLAPRPHWHIDHLRAAAALVEVWYAAAAQRLEHDWAAQLQRAAALTTPLPGFGASDCRCPSHLFFTLEPPEPALLAGVELQVVK